MKCNGKDRFGDQCLNDDLKRCVDCKRIYCSWHQMSHDTKFRSSRCRSHKFVDVQ